MTWPHPLTHSSTQPPTHPHPPMGGSVSTNHKFSNRIELSWFSQQFLNFSDFTWPHPLTQPPTHPPMNYTPTHGWRSLHRFQIFEQNWNILISSSTIEFWLIPGVPPRGGGLGGWGSGVVTGSPHRRAHAHTCMHIWHHMESPGFPQNPMGMAICMELSCLPCMHVHVCGGTPQPHPPSPNPHPPSPPTPRATGSPKHQNSISLELIEIFQFCLKILYLWTFLNSYRV